MFADASDQLDAWWGKPVLVIPGAAQQARALSRMSEIGIDLAASGSRTSLAADPEATKLTGGTVPLAKIAALETPLTEAHASLLTAAKRFGRVDATWLVAPIDNKLSNLRSKVTRAAHDAETGIQAARVVPSLLGANGQTKRYFVAFQTPAEQTRASAGIIGNYAVVSFTDGHLTLEMSGRDSDLNLGGEGPRTLVGPPDYVARYAQYGPQDVWQNVTVSPDWPSVATGHRGPVPAVGRGAGRRRHQRRPESARRVPEAHRPRPGRRPRHEAHQEERRELPAPRPVPELPRPAGARRRARQRRRRGDRPHPDRRPARRGADRQGPRADGARRAG